MEKGDRTKEKIITSAIRLFSRDGYDAVSMRTIADEVGIRAGSIYGHFAGKEDIYEEILAYTLVRLNHYSLTREEVLELLETRTPEEILTRYLTFYERDDGDNDLYVDLYRLMYMEQYRDEKTAKIATEFFVREPVRNIVTVLETLEETGHIPHGDHRALAELWSRTLLIYGVHETHDRHSVDYGEYVDMARFFIQAAMRGIRILPTEQLDVHWTLAGLFEEDGGISERDTWGRILLQALDLFSEHGYNSVSIRQIAAAAGIQGGSLYNHFSSKSEIMQEIIRHVLNRYDIYHLSNPTFRAVLDAGDPMRIILSLACSHPPMREELVIKIYRILFREQYHNEDIKDFFIGSIFRDITSIEELLEEMVRQGRIPPCESRKIAVAYVHTMCSITVGETLPHTGPELGRIRLRTVALLVSLILNGYLDQEDEESDESQTEPQEVEGHV